MSSVESHPDSIRYASDCTCPSREVSSCFATFSKASFIRRCRSAHSPANGSCVLRLWLPDLPDSASAPARTDSIGSRRSTPYSVSVATHPARASRDSAAPSAYSGLQFGVSVLRVAIFFSTSKEKAHPRVLSHCRRCSTAHAKCSLYESSSSPSCRVGPRRNRASSCRRSSIASSSHRLASTINRSR